MPVLCPLETAVVDLRPLLRPQSDGQRPITPPVIATFSLPETAIARRAGFAMAALDTLDASPAAPLLLTEVPPRLRIGDALPPGTDCIVPPELIERRGALIQLIGSAMPGEGTRRAGADARPGDLLPAATDADALLNHLIGACNLPLDLVISTAPPSEALEKAIFEGLALRPGEDARLGWRAERLTLIVPALADAVLALWLALIAPASGYRMAASVTAPLTAKLTSAIGFDELALLRFADGAFVPLAVADLPLSALGAATHWAILPASSEGADAGTLLSAHPLRDLP